MNTLAAIFARMLREDLGDNMPEVNALNATPDYIGCCASHNFCDANMVMLAAYAELHSCNEDDIRLDDDSVLGAMNSAWDEARLNNFWVQS